MNRLRILARGILLRCPNCGRAPIYRLFFTAHRECPRCGHDYERDPGDWTGGAEMMMLLAFPLAILLLFLLMTFGNLHPLWELAIVMGAVAVFVPLGYRHVKGFWLAVLRVWDGPDPKANPIQEPEWFRQMWEDGAR